MNKKMLGLQYLFIIFLLATLSACEPSDKTPTATPVQLSVNVDLQQVALGPQIVARSPLAGQRLDLMPVLQLTFDRDMNRQATAAAWTFNDAENNPVSGSITWLDNCTFQFAPEARLTPDAEYWGVFSNSASALDGKTLTEEIRIKFHTSTALSVGEAFPADGAADVDPNTSITVVFNRPIVPLTIVEGQDTLPQPLEFFPQVAGRGE